MGLVKVGSKYATEVIGQVASQNGYLRRQAWVDTATADADLILDGQASSNSVVTTVTTFLAQPDYARNLVITPGGTTTDVAAGDIVVTGTNIRGEVITESFAFTANQSAATTGNKAFKTVTSVVIPVQDGAAATFDVGTGVKMGLDRSMAGNEVILATADGVYETTRPTVAASTAAIESNTVTTNTAPNGSRDFAVAYVSSELTS